VRAAVATAFEAVDLGEPNWFLGMEIRRDRAQGLIRLSQTNLIRTMLGRFGLSDCRSVCTPLDPGAVLQKDGRDGLEMDFFKMGLHWMMSAQAT
jgi:hypothetical protein